MKPLLPFPKGLNFVKNSLSNIQISPANVHLPENENHYSVTLSSRKKQTKNKYQNFVQVANVFENYICSIL